MMDQKIKPSGTSLPESHIQDIAVHVKSNSVKNTMHACGACTVLVLMEDAPLRCSTSAEERREQQSFLNNLGTTVNTTTS
jgi:hypothetical protein